MTRSEAWQWLVSAAEEGMRKFEQKANDGVDGALSEYELMREAFGFLDEFQDDLGV